MKTVQLKKDGANAVVKSVGGELASYIPAGGTEYIWQADPAVWGQHSPVLFPIVCSLKDDTVQIDGVPYKMNKHGFLAHMPFEVDFQNQDEITMVARATEETKRMYPFDFAVYITHKIYRDGFTTTFRVENEGTGVMPMCIGGHPGFICPRNEGEVFTDYLLEFPEVERGENTLCPGGDLIVGTEILPAFKDSNTIPLKHEYFDEKDALMLTNLKSRSVRLIHKETKKGLNFIFDGFDVLGVWTKPHANADYVCLEPWCGLPASVDDSPHFEDKPYVKFVERGNPFEVSYSMEVLK